MEPNILVTHFYPFCPFRPKTITIKYSTNGLWSVTTIAIPKNNDETSFIQNQHPLPLNLTVDAYILLYYLF